MSKMKRKVLKVGNVSLAVSLPSEWTKKTKVKPGDELDVSIEEGYLVIGAKSRNTERSVEIDLTGFGSMLNRTVAAIYKAGFHNVRMKYSTPEELEVIQGTIERSCHVYEIMRISGNAVEVKTISELDSENFDTVFRKIGFAVKEMADETLKAMKTQDYDLMHAIVLQDKIVDRHSDFCRRVINSGFIPEHQRVGPLYAIPEESEILADIFKTLCKEMIAKKPKIESDIIELTEQINKVVAHFYETLYNFNIKNVQELGRHEVKTKKMLDAVCAKQRKDAKILCHLNNIFETAFEMKSVLMTLRVGS